VAQGGELAREVPDVDALAAAVRLAPVGQERDAERPTAVSGHLEVLHARSCLGVLRGVSLPTRCYRR